MSQLDLRGLKCPLPALMAAKRLAALPAGAVLEVWTTDPMAVVDIPHMCHQEGHSLQDSRAGEGHHIFVIVKA